MVFPPFRRSQKPEIQQIRRGLGNGFRKRSGLYKIDNFWAFVGFPSFRRSQKPEIQQIRRGLGNGFRKRSGLYKIDNFWAFVRFPQQIRSGLGCGFRTKSTTFWLLWGSLHFGGPEEVGKSCWLNASIKFVRYRTGIEVRWSYYPSLCFFLPDLHDCHPIQNLCLQLLRPETEKEGNRH